MCTNYAKRMLIVYLWIENVLAIMYIHASSYICSQNNHIYFSLHMQAQAICISGTLLTRYFFNQEAGVGAIIFLRIF